MIIAIPVDENKTETSVCVSFGRAPYYLIHNTETGNEEFIVNIAANAEGGAGLKAAQLVVDSAADVLKAADVTVYKTTAPLAADNLAAFKEGKLAVMTQFHAGFHGHQ
jgi:predicted Fe-Mo cluster-binding NifX family protein